MTQTKRQLLNLPFQRVMIRNVSPVAIRLRNDFQSFVQLLQFSSNTKFQTLIAAISQNLSDIPQIFHKFARIMEKKRTKIVFVPVGGLANRMYSTCAAITLAKKVCSELQIIWFRDQALHAAFHDLFSPSQLPSTTQIKEATISDLFIYDRPRKRNFYIPSFFQKIIFKSYRLYEYQTHQLHSQNFDFKTWAKNGGYIASYMPFYPYPKKLLKDIFVPVPKIKEVIKVRCSRFSGYTVGVHIRRTDNILSIQHSPIEAFYKYLDKEQAEHPDLCIYLATDSEDVKKEMIARYGEKIICAENKANRDTTEGIRDGIADLFTLANTQKIYGSFHSSFSIMASELGNIPLTVVEKYK